MDCACEVLTLTLKVDAVVALTETVDGTEQTAPVGAPVQVSVAVPLIPLPPMDSVYEAVAPAATVAEFEPPGATARPRLLTPVPLSGTVCGLSAALSVIVMLPVVSRPQSESLDCSLPPSTCREKPNGSVQRPFRDEPQNPVPSGCDCPDNLHSAKRLGSESTLEKL
jgi:hypothetical protein